MVFQFQLSQKHLDYQKSVEEYLQHYKSSNGTELLKSLASDGYISLPNLEGSKPSDYLALALTVEEVSKYYPKVANTMVELLFAQEVVKKYAQPSCQMDCLNKIRKLELPINILFSEPGNNDVKALATKIEKTANGYKVTGTKIFAPENIEAKKYLVVGRLVKETGSELAIVAVEADKINMFTKEINYGAHSLKLELAEINTEVPTDKIMLNIDDNLRYTLAVWRTLTAASAIGLAHTNLITSMNVVKNTKNSENQLLTNSEAIQFTLADMFGEIEGARLVTYYSAAYIDADKPSIRFSTIAKVQATEAAVFSNSQSANLIGNIGNIYDSIYLEALQLAYNRQIKDGTYTNSYNIIYEEALARR